MHDLGFQLLETSDATAQIRQGLSSLLSVVPGDVAGEIEVPHVGVPRITEVPDLLLGPEPTAEVLQVVRTSPALAFFAVSRHLVATRVEDLCTSAEWARNPMRRLLLEPKGVPYALLAGDRRGAGAVLGWGINRSRPFGDDDVELADAFAHFLRRAAADRRLRRLVDDLERAVSSGAGLVVSRGPVVVHLNDEALRLVERHQVDVVTVSRLGLATLGPSQPVGALPTRHGTLRLRWRPALAGTSVVVVDEPGQAPGGDRPLLTVRQYVILCHLSHGLTAAAIARQAGITERTVHKHLENLYRALSVVDRLAAVSRGRDLGLLPVVGGCSAIARAADARKS